MRNLEESEFQSKIALVLLLATGDCVAIFRLKFYLIAKQQR